MGNPKKRGKKAAGAKRMRSSSSEKIRALLERIPVLECREHELIAQLEIFEDRDRPEFDEWLGSEFAAERDELKMIEREREILELAHLAADGGIFFAAPKNPGKAFVKAEQELREEFAAEDAEAEALDNPAGYDPSDELIDEMLDSFLEEVRGLDPNMLDTESYARMREDFVASFEHVKAGNRTAFEKAILRLGVDQSEGNVSEAKSVFRRIVRELHPDRKEEFGEVEKKLWNEAMLLNEARDAEGLKLIEIRIKVHRHQAISPSETPLVRRYQKQLQDRIFLREQALLDAQEHPAWEFSKKKGRKNHLKSLARGFIDCLQQAREHLEDLVRSAHEYREAAERQVRRKKAVVKKAVARKTGGKKGNSRNMDTGPAGKAPPASERSNRNAKSGPLFVQDEFPF
jgi:hypothetical protein